MPGIRISIAVFAALAMSAAPAAADAPSKRHPSKRSKANVHTVSQGQTLWQIARAHGCDVRAITKANGLSNSKVLQIGQKLRIPKCGSSSRHAAATGASTESSYMVHEVVSGDTLGRIAKQYDTSVKNIRARNGLDGNMIHPGQKLRIIPGRGGKGRPIIGQSIGAAGHGRLHEAVQLPSSRNYHRRRPYRAWGTNQLIHHIKRVTAIVKDRYPRTHKLSIGDLSAKKGGHLSPHISHQSGRDVDLGFYFKHKPKGYPKSFHRATKNNLDMKASWLLVRTLAATHDQPGGVYKIFMDYYLQKIFYEWALERHVSRRLLDSMFEYPNGRGSGGLIHHDLGGHDDHFHVRFKCPKRDKKCRN